jgi:NADH-quinone oxidoreductase subunit F
LGEEKALLEVIEGEDPLPRRDPPYLHGLFASGPQMGWSAHIRGDAGGEAANPTIVNNVETLAAVPHILTNGADWYRALGTWDSPGTMVFTVVGDVARPGYAELGTTIRDVIEQVGGGPRPGRQIKAVFSTPVPQPSHGSRYAAGFSGHPRSRHVADASAVCPGQGPVSPAG